MDEFNTNGNHVEAKNMLMFLGGEDIRQGIINYNATIKGYHKLEMMSNAIYCFNKMKVNGLYFDKCAHITIMNDFVKNNDLDRDFRIFGLGNFARA